MVDLHGFFRARWFSGREAPALPLYATEGVLARVASLEDTEADGEDVRKVFDWHPLPAGVYEVGPFRLDSWALPHHVLNAGVRLSAAGLTLAYTGDTGPDPALVELGRDADLYIVEASDRGQSPVPPETTGPRMHLTAREA
jgi:Beta-lactamase superfamily domain